MNKTPFTGNPGPANHNAGSSTSTRTIATRRNFLKTAGIAAAGSLLLPELLLTAAHAESASSAKGAPSAKWKPSVKVRNIGIQLYTVRKEMLADPVANLTQLAKIGFKELESARSEKDNYYGLSPKEIKKISTDPGMHLRSGHIHVDKDWKKSIEEATRTGQKYLISSTIPNSIRFTTFPNTPAASPYGISKTWIQPVNKAPSLAKGRSLSWTTLT